MLRCPWGGIALQPSSYETEDKIASVVHQLLKERAIDKRFHFQDNLLSVGLTSLDMTSLILSVEAEFSIQIPDRVITPANFMSVATIGRLLRDLTSSGGSASRPSEPAESGSSVSKPERMPHPPARC
jgi:acyl carrier protein